MKKVKTNFLVYFCLIFCLLISIFNVVPASVFAEDDVADVVYSGVLEDLQKDELFSIDDYPVIDSDSSLKIIQLAESSNRELFVYVYQPSVNKDLNATRISLSTGINDNASWKLYNLTLLSSEGVFGKYKVDDFQVLKDALRYYDITEIYRKWNKDFDDEPIDDNTVSEVSYNLSQRWTASTVNGVVSYTCVTTDVITVTDKHVGFIRYSSGILWSIYGSCDSHYIAFSTDLQIDDLIEADIYYVSTPIAAIWSILGHWNYVHNNTYGVSSEHYAFIKEGDITTSCTSWSGGKKFIRDRIQSVSDFMAQEKLDNNTKEILKDKKWVLRFFESKYDSSGDYYYWTNVEDVTILRLKFETAGDTYNLGVVDNLQSGDNAPDNKQESWVDKLLKFLKDFVTYLPYILLGIVGLILVVILAIFTPVFSLMFKGLGYCFYGLWWLVTAPFEIFKE